MQKPWLHKKSSVGNYPRAVEKSRNELAPLAAIFTPIYTIYTICYTTCELYNFPI